MFTFLNTHGLFWLRCGCKCVQTRIISSVVTLEGFRKMQNFQRYKQREQREKAYCTKPAINTELALLVLPELQENCSAHVQLANFKIAIFIGFPNAN